MQITTPDKTFVNLCSFKSKTFAVSQFHTTIRSKFGVCSVKMTLIKSTLRKASMH